MNRGLRFFCSLWISIAVLTLTSICVAESGESSALLIIPSDTGRIGAWLVAGPFKNRPDPPSGGLSFGSDVEGPGERRPVRAFASSRGPQDLLLGLGVPRADLQYALASVRLDVRGAGEHTLLLGVDDGVTVWLDGREIFSRDEARPLRDADDVIPLELTSGKHDLVLRLHQRYGGWGFRARLVDAQWSRPNIGILLPGAADRGPEIARNLADVRLEQIRKGELLWPRVRVSFPEGRAPGVALPVHLSVEVDGRATFDASAGDASVRHVVDAAGHLETEWSTVLPPLGGVDARVNVDVGGAPFSLHAGATREALEALGAADSVTRGAASSLARESYAFARQRLESLVQAADRDRVAQAVEANELLAMTRDLLADREPYRDRAGVMRRAYRSPIDGELHEFALYVPRGYKDSAPRPFPLVVVLHGMDGHAMSGLQWFFGRDDLRHDSAWEDRHIAELPPLDAFVLAPSGLGNTMYREMGLEDVMHAIDRVKDSFLIDGDRVTITGPSMGGIGSAMAALRFPSTFAAAMPLCGYHSLFVRRDVRGVATRPWESVLAEERSNVSWAENGAHVPMWIVHGTRDLPEENSGVLVDRYDALGFSMKHDHPEMGHDVWKWAYPDFKGARWLLQHQRPRVAWTDNRIKTYRTRFGASGAAQISSQDRYDAPAELTTWARGIDVQARASNVHEFSVARPSSREPVRLRVGDETLRFESGEEIRVHRDGSAPAAHWQKGGDATFRKRDRVTGPIRDVFHEPIVFVYGTKDPAFARVGEEVARRWAAVRAGVTVKYPILSDREFLARGEPTANDRALFLIGGAGENEVTARLGDRLPIRVEKGELRVGDRAYRGEDLGATYVFPNPDRHDRYVVVVLGATPRGLWYANYLPDLLPDFVVYDAGVVKSRGQLLLGRGNTIAGGFFDPEWRVAEIAEDKRRQAPAPKTEREATPYLP